MICNSCEIYTQYSTIHVRFYIWNYQSEHSFRDRPLPQAPYRRMIFVIERQSVGGERRLVGTEFHIIFFESLVLSCLQDHYGPRPCAGYGEYFPTRLSGFFFLPHTFGRSSRHRTTSFFYFQDCQISDSSLAFHGPRTGRHL